MPKLPRKKEETRGMKHLLIHRLFRLGYEVSEPLGPQRGQDLIVGKIKEGTLECVVAQVRTCSLSDKKDYVFNVPSRVDFKESPRYFHLICLENKRDNLRPTYLVIPNPKLKQLVEKKLRKPESWKEEDEYGCHVSVRQLKEQGWLDLKGKFKLIDNALKRVPTPASYGNKEKRNER